MAVVPAPPKRPTPSDSNAATSECSGQAAEATDESVPAKATPGHCASSLAPSASSCPTSEPNSAASSAEAARSTQPPEASALLRARANAATSRSEFSQAKAKAGAAQVEPAGARRSADSPGGGAYAPGKKGVPAPRRAVTASLKQKGAPASGPSTTSPPVVRAASLSWSTSRAHACARSRSGKPSVDTRMATHAKRRLVCESAATSTPSSRRESSWPSEAITETPPPTSASRAPRRPSSCTSCSSASAGAASAHWSQPLVAIRTICRSTPRARSSPIAARKKPTDASTRSHSSSNDCAEMKYVTARTFMRPSWSARPRPRFSRGARPFPRSS